METNVEFPKKLGFLFTPKRYKVLYGGRGGLKSWSVAQALLILGAQKPLRILCAREIQRSIQESVHQLLRDQIAKLGLEDFYDVLNTEVRGKNGTQFLFAGLKHNIDSIKSKEGIDIVWVEEAANVSKQSWDTLIPTIRKDGSEIWITFNPLLDEDETYERFVLNPPVDSVVCKTTWRDNKWLPEVLRKEKDDLQARDPVAYDNVWEGNCKAAVDGAIYAEELNKAQQQGRIREVKYDPLYPVSAFLDLGWADNTSIWFLQIVNGEFRLIGSYQNQFQKTPHYVEYMQKTGYTFNRIVLPHDAEAEHANADRTWLQIYRQAFPNARVYAGERRAVALRLEAAKNIFDKCVFDKEKCADGLSALRRYHFATNPDTGRLTSEPFHGEESNYADAFGYMALEAMAPSREKPKPKPRPATGWRSAVGM